MVIRQGVFLITGNHEHLVDTRAWLRHLPTLGVEVLRNQAGAVSRSAGGAARALCAALASVMPVAMLATRSVAAAPWDVRTPP